MQTFSWFLRLISGEQAEGGWRLLDEQLVQRIKAGDNAAFTTLIENNQGKVYSVAYGLVRNSEDAMDISQETFLRAWDKIATWRGEASLSTWLCRIASNLSLDMLRKQKRVVPVREIVFAPGEVQRGPDADILSAEQKAELENAVAQLPEEYRHLVILRHAGAMSYRDMATTLGLSLSQVKNRLLRARQMLKRSLTGRVD